MAPSNLCHFACEKYGPGIKQRVQSLAECQLRLPIALLVHFPGPASDFQVLMPPVPIPSHAMAMMWHERSHHDPGHRWLREQIVGVL
jgi:DNA-binding transcriptional LysR family regulator